MPDTFEVDNPTYVGPSTEATSSTEQLLAATKKCLRRPYVHLMCAVSRER
jgi:hypothetical protein